MKNKYLNITNNWIYMNLNNIKNSDLSLTISLDQKEIKGRSKKEILLLQGVETRFFVVFFLPISGLSSVNPIPPFFLPSCPNYQTLSPLLQYPNFQQRQQFNSGNTQNPWILNYALTILEINGFNLSLDTIKNPNN